MGFYHTEPNQTKLYVGSGRVFIADVAADAASAVWKPLGTMSALAVTGKLTTAQPSAVNGQHKKIVTEEGASIAMSLQEIVPDNLKECTGDLTTISAETASPVAGYAQTIPANTGRDVFVPFSHQSYDSSGKIIAPTGISVIQGVSGEMNENEDYEIITDSCGMYGIMFLNGSPRFSSPLAKTVTYTYTPVAKTVIHQGGKVTTTDKMVKIENEQSDGRKITMIYYLCSFAEGGNLNLKTDGASDLIDFNVTLEARNDLSRPAGSQLYEIAFS